MAHVVAGELSPLETGELTILFEPSKVKRASDFNTTVAALGRIFDEAYLLGFRYELSENWSTFMSALYDGVTQDQLHNVTLTGKLNDSFSLQLLWLNIEEKEKSSALAGYTKNDQAQIQIEYFF